MIKEANIDYAYTYALELENGRYYVGATKNLHERIGAHFLGEGSRFTKMHKPVRVAKVWTGNVEREMTLRGMKQYGIDYVRGAVWTEVHSLTPKARATVEKEIGELW